MSSGDDGLISTLGFAHARELDAVCDAFELAWKQDAGARPVLQAHLEQLPAELRGSALLELLPLEIAYLRRRGETIPIEDYRVRYPLAQSYLDGWVRDQQPPQVPHRLAPGDRFGKYTILAWLGAGGMGEVYRASDSSLGREVAIKVLLHRHRRSAEALARIEVEAHALAALNHPQILTVHELAQHDGLDYMVLELLEGETLAQRLRRSSLAPDEVLALAGQLAAALAVAHEKKIVHRDLKPQNIFLTEGGQAKILDFGLARLLEAPAANVPTTQAAAAQNGGTVAGARLGTTGYMSPEQIRGESVGAGSDVFSFGCVLYEMACGTPVFARKTAEDSDAAILLEPTPKPPSLRRGPLADLFPVIARCLEKVADDRYASARELSQELQRIQDKRARRVGQAFRGLERVLLVAVCLLVVAIGGWVWRRVGQQWAMQSALAQIKAMPETPPDPEALRPLVKKCRELAHEVGYPARALDDVRERQYSVMMAFLEREGGTKAGIDAAINYFSDAIAADSEFAAAYVGLGECYYRLSSAYARPDEAMEKMKAVADKALALDASETAPSSAIAHVLLALYYHRYKWKWDDPDSEHCAKWHFEKALSINPNSTMALRYYGNSLVLQGEFDEGIKKLNEARSHDYNSAELKVDLGLAYLYAQEYSSAKELLRSVLQTDPKNFSAHWALGEVFLHRKEFRKASLQLAIAHVLDEDSPEVQAELAICLGKESDQFFETSAEKILQELEERVGNPGARPSRRYVSSTALAVAQIAVGQTELALENLRKGFDEHDEWLVWLQIDPVFDDLRNTDEFKAIVDELGLWRADQSRPEQNNQPRE